MTWQISGNGGTITLPIDPQDVKQQMIRQPKVLQMQSAFPFPIDIGPQVFNVIVTGLVWPQSVAEQLDEMTKNADLQVLQITEDSEQYNGLYAVDRATIERQGPEYSPDSIAAGTDGKVYHYEIWFAQFAAQGNMQPGDQGNTSSTEPGVGFPDLSTVLGNIQQQIFQFFTNLTG